MRTYKFKLKTKRGSDVWVTKIQHGSPRMRAIKSNRSKSGAFVDITANVLARAVVNSVNSGATLRSGRKPPRLIDRVKELQLLEAEMEIPTDNTYGGHSMDALDRKIVDIFPGKVVRKDLTALMKKGANVPTYVLEYPPEQPCQTHTGESVLRR